MLKLNVIALENRFQVEVNFVNDDTHAIADVTTKALKKHDKVVFIGYSIFIDENSLKYLLVEKLPQGYSGMVLASAKDGIDWEMFKQKVRSGSTEPVDQMGINFDTEIDKKITDDVWSVKSTESRAWMLDSKSVIKTLRERKGDGLKVPLRQSEMLNKLKLCTYIKSKVITTHTHECLSNILESAGIKVVNEGIPSERGRLLGGQK